MSADIRVLFQRQLQRKQAKETNSKKTPVIVDEEDDFKPVPSSKAAGVRNKEKTAKQIGGGKRKRTRRIVDSDSEEETTKKKKVKTTPSKKSVGNLKGGKSPAPVVKREIKSVADFFGPAPVQRSVSSRVTRSSNAEKRKSEDDIVRVSESPTDETGIHQSATKCDPASSQPAVATPTKKMRLLVDRIATPSPKHPRNADSALPATPQHDTPTECVSENAQKEMDVRKTDRGPHEMEREGRGGEGEREGRGGEGEGEGGGEGEERESKVVGGKRGSKAEVGSQECKVEGEESRESKRLRQPKARKAIKYLDDSEEEETAKTGGGGGRKEQTVLTTTSTAANKSLVIVSPVKRSSPRRPRTPEREGCLVKQPGLAFDKEKSASPIKTPRKQVSSNQGRKPVPSPVESASSPAKLVSNPPSQAKSLTPVSHPKPAKPVSTPATTPKPSRGSSYRNYMNRAGPKAPGSKVIPEGEENCLEGLTFVITGVLDSIERDQAADLVKRYGGKVTGNVSRKTSYLVVGEDAGESKLAKAAQLGTKQLDEDGLLELVRTRPAKKTGISGRRTKKESTAAKTSVPSSPPSLQSEGSLKGAKFKAKSPPSKGVHSSVLTCGGSSRGDTLTTPTRNHVTTPVAMATPSPSASIAAETPQPSTEGGDSLMWVDKYRPKTLKQIIGQQGDKSNAKKLLKWLLEWEKSHLKPKGGGKKGGRGGWGSSSQGDGEGFRGALLSGPPGVGKTTTATLVCEEAGYSYVELNASSTRSKKTLHDVVATHLDCMTLDAFRATNVGVASGRRHVLIMDEVDGMAGNEDRGGVQEVISMIKTTKVPIICICNDRQHPKIRSLANHCFDLRFYRPRVDQIRGAMMSVCFKEGVKLSANALAEIIMASGQDVRQVLHNLSVWTATQKNMSYDQAKETAKSAKKESKLNPFDVIKLVFMPTDGGRDLTLHERSELFFHDYSLAPLFVQENYPNVKPLQAKGDVKHTLRLLGDTADCLSHGDLIEKKIRSGSHWGLLPMQAIFSSVLPGQLMRGNVGRPEFPRWLGNRSTRGKNDRQLQELQQHTRLTASCNKTEFGLDYLPFLQRRLTTPLIDEGSDGVMQVVAMMTTYDLSREDWDSIVDLNQFPGRPNRISDLPSKVKAAFTRTYNKEHHKTHYAAGNSQPKKSRVATVSEYHDDSLDSEPESDSDLSQERTVKVKRSVSRDSEGRGERGRGEGGRGRGKGKNGGKGKKA